MVPLTTTQKVAMWCCVPTDKDSSKLKQISHIFVTGFMAEVGSFAGALTLLLKFISSDLEISLSGLLPLIGHIIGVYSIIFVVFSRHQINGLFEKLANIYEISKK